MNIPSPLELIKREYYFRRAYREFEQAAETANKEDAYSPRKTEASDQIGEAMKFVDKALDGETYDTTDFQAGMHFATLTEENMDPVNYKEFKEYFEALEQA